MGQSSRDHRKERSLTKRSSSKERSFSFKHCLIGQWGKTSQVIFCEETNGNLKGLYLPPF